MWCVHVYPDGTFRHARPLDAGRIAWSIKDWLSLDREAAQQFIDPDGHQRAFIHAAGLDRTDVVRNRIREVHTSV